ncbi:GGDEF domain-containing protein [Sulfuricaulis limicola]|uniref:GGDEF domain-containing protein n=1 Tax=Sulfuricaulis limicola TaxID=1620215 RepID=UPI001E5525C0|nr:GGDEF domain-containing protein [Sulfuricaulis limicola]
MQDESEASGASSSKKLLGLLEGLKRTPVGAVIYDQVARIVEEQEGVQAKVDHVYASLLHLLLNAYARDPSADHITRINARLIQLRRGPILPRAGKVPDETIEAKLHQAAESQVPGRPPAEVTKPAPAPEPAARVKPAPAPTPGPAPTTSPGNGATEAERRVDAAYRQHLDQQRSEIEKLQQTLARTVTDAITQNREFGALLQIELRALQQANGDKEVEQLRQILVGGLEELIQGQNSLEAKLHKTGGYLRLIKADSERLHEELNKVRLLSLTDEFTGLPNRRAFMRRLQDEISRSQRYGASLALAIIDLDEFKAINDIHGHATGDAILRCYATEVLTVLRHHDLVARYGGEEFAILMPNTTREGAVAAIEKVRGRALQVICEFQGRDFRLPTFSTGVALYVVGESHTDLIDRADRALYRAKRLGRNRIELEQGLPAATPPRGKNSGGA